MAATNSPRIAYSEAEIDAFFSRIAVPGDRRHRSVGGLTSIEALNYLTYLQRQHLVHIPFENLSLHYSIHRQISLHPQELFRKVVQPNRGRGGYCMENNALFGTLLHSLGFNTYTAGARVFNNGQWSGWSHMVNLVTIGNTKYHVDVGFGADGPMVPMSLIRDGAVQAHVQPAAARLQWRNIPGNTDPNQRLWVYEYRKSDTADWEIKYCYTELEFQACDYSIMNFFTSNSPHTFFTRSLIAEKKVLSDDQEVEGSIILFDQDFKYRVRGRETKQTRLVSEAQRLAVLKDVFGISLSDIEKDGIRGLGSEIR